MTVGSAVSVAGLICVMLGLFLIDPGPELEGLGPPLTLVGFVLVIVSLVL